MVTEDNGALMEPLFLLERQARGNVLRTSIAWLGDDLNLVAFPLGVDRRFALAARSEDYRHVCNETRVAWSRPAVQNAQ